MGRFSLPTELNWFPAKTNEMLVDCRTATSDKKCSLTHKSLFSGHAHVHSFPMLFVWVELQGVRLALAFSFSHHAGPQDDRSKVNKRENYG